VRRQYQLATVIHRKTLSIESIKLCNDPELSSLLEDWHHQKLRPNVISQLTETYIDDADLISAKQILTRRQWSRNALYHARLPVVVVAEYSRRLPNGQSYRWTEQYFNTRDVLRFEQAANNRSREPRAAWL